MDRWKAAKKVVGNSDSDFASCVDSRKSTSRYIFMMASGAISWRSSKQTLTATSTTKVEFVACFKATSHGVWLKSFISGLRIVDSIARPLKIYYDNSAAYLAIREHVKENKVVIEHIGTELMITNPLTKGMPTMGFKDHVDCMGLGSTMQ
ncbi:hypothetical protein CRG98_024694 [Punica granatum]|uniref:Copia protein n=1 Tax=Punica granatum TaxID=22663 RepID=A0A2I0JF72_PUNGR|nr:hypothetical protein CRG98_024694 [Punica granatum]